MDGSTTAFVNRSKKTHFCSRKAQQGYRPWFCDTNLTFISFKTENDQKSHHSIAWGVPKGFKALLASVYYSDGGLDIFFLDGAGYCDDVYSSARAVDRVEVDQIS